MVFMKIIFFVLRLFCIPIFIFTSRATIIIMTNIGFHNYLLENGLERENIYIIFFVTSCFFTALICVLYLKFVSKLKHYFY